MVSDSVFRNKRACLRGTALADGPVSAVAESFCVFGAVLIGRLMRMSMGAARGYDDGLQFNACSRSHSAW